MLTLEELQDALPSHLKTAATPDLLDKLNLISEDPEYARTIRENFISYTSVLKEGKFKTEDYLNAVAYVSYKLMGHTNKDAYQKTFPDRYTDLVADGRSEKEISSYVAGYHKNKLVNMIMEQSLIPSWIINQDIYQRAINTQFSLMTDENVSAKVRSDAADSILNHLKRPEVKKVQLDVSARDTSGMAELRQTMQRLAEQQRDLIAGGVSARQIAHDTIIDAEFSNVPSN